jgi:hypothetical protein
LTRTRSEARRAPNATTTTALRPDAPLGTTEVDCVSIANDALGLLEQVSRPGADCEVVIEATYGWYWPVDLPLSRNVHRQGPHKRRRFVKPRV